MTWHSSRLSPLTELGPRALTPHVVFGRLTSAAEDRQNALTREECFTRQ